MVVLEADNLSGEHVFGVTRGGRGPDGIDTEPAAGEIWSHGY